ncbi:MAG: SprB repeat-containing protein [Cytophagaceae bacterium]|nr:SprB repeat-containing protein [Cytophagaceae bacterium]
MKNLVYLLFLFLFTGSSFTYHFPNGNHPLAKLGQTLALDVKIEQPQTASSNDGTIDLTVSGGTAPYTIQVISTFIPSQVYKKEHVELKKLGAGNYIIMVQDAEKHVLQKTIELNPVQ